MELRRKEDGEKSRDRERRLLERGVEKKETDRKNKSGRHTSQSEQQRIGNNGFKEVEREKRIDDAHFRLEYELDDCLVPGISPLN